jgi:hypothetical protein
VKSIQEIRQAIDEGLDFIQTKAEAAQVQLALGNMELQERFGEQFQELCKSASGLQAKLTELNPGDDNMGQQLQQAMDKLQVQLALGEMESKDALTELKADIERRVDELDAVIDAYSTEESEAVVSEVKEALNAYSKQAVAMKAEIAARLDSLS